MGFNSGFKGLKWLKVFVASQTLRFKGFGLLYTIRDRHKYHNFIRQIISYTSARVLSTALKVFALPLILDSFIFTTRHHKQSNLTLLPARPLSESRYTNAQ